MKKSERLHETDIHISTDASYMYVYRRVSECFSRLVLEKEAKKTWVILYYSLFFIVDIEINK
jgi:hypothetical protein